jgi:hypothetical protein
MNRECIQREKSTMERNLGHSRESGELHWLFRARKGFLAVHHLSPFAMLCFSNKPIDFSNTRIDNLALPNFYFCKVKVFKIFLSHYNGEGLSPLPH